MSLLREPRFTLMHDDVRWFDPAALRDMAAIVNDPAGELNPGYRLQGWGSGGFAGWGLAATCLSPPAASTGTRGVVDESLPPNPLTTYARADCLGRVVEE